MDGHMTVATKGRTTIPTAISLYPDQVEDLNEIAESRRAGRSQIMREAIDAYIEANGGPRRQARIAAEQPEPVTA